MAEGKMSKRQTVEQERAASAWGNIDDVKSDEQKKKYGTLARKLPAMIQMNGLGATMAFLCAKGKIDPDPQKPKRAVNGHSLIYDHISHWVLSQLKRIELKPDENYGNIMELVQKADTTIYRRATAEAIEYGIWLKRYVEAMDWGSEMGDEER